MKLYKFKDFTNESNHPHFLQIVLEKKIWCASPDSLNDEDEFNFELDYTPSSNTETILTQLIAQSRAPDSLISFSPSFTANQTLANNILEESARPIVEDIIQKTRQELGVTSFSSIVNSTLWERYGGNGNGACIEINIPDSLIGDDYHRVDYVPKKIFHIDIFLGATLSNSNNKENKVFRNILFTKTDAWRDEKEFRYIGKEQNLNFVFDGHISKVIFGAKVPNNVKQKLLCQISNHCNSNNIIISTSET
jgi:hypothetical protein